MSKLRCTVSANYGGYFFKTCTCMHLVPIKIKACNCKWILQNQWDGAIMYLRSHSSFFWLAGNKLTLLNYFEIFIFIFWTFIFIINNIITNISVQIFALCCAVTGVILTFDIYTGDTYYAHKNTSDIVKNLVIVSELSENTGYVVYGQLLHYSEGNSNTVWAIQMIGLWNCSNEKEEEKGFFIRHWRLPMKENDQRSCFIFEMWLFLNCNSSFLHCAQF